MWDFAAPGVETTHQNILVFTNKMVVTTVGAIADTLDEIFITFYVSSKSHMTVLLQR
jgi:hypothetical protein